MILQIPLSILPNQEFSVELDGKLCNFELITRGDRLYFNKITIDDEVKICGIACLNKSDILKFFPSGLSGKLYFLDTEGDKEPVFTGFNTRWLLLYEV